MRRTEQTLKIVQHIFDRLCLQIALLCIYVRCCWLINIVLLIVLDAELSQVYVKVVDRVVFVTSSNAKFFQGRFGLVLIWEIFPILPLRKEAHICDAKFYEGRVMNVLVFFWVYKPALFFIRE